MSISDKKTLRRAAFIYFAFAAFCGIFAAVYESFSHGVYSGYMEFMFLYPLAGGAAQLLPTFIPSARCPGRLSRNFFGTGVAALTVGSCVEGVFEIYGTTAELVTAYWVAGAASVAIAALLYAAGHAKKDT